MPIDFEVKERATYSSSTIRRGILSKETPIRETILRWLYSVDQREKVEKTTEGKWIEEIEKGKKQ